MLLMMMLLLLMMFTIRVIEEEEDRRFKDLEYIFDLMKQNQSGSLEETL
jgi:hypothetical protein